MKYLRYIIFLYLTFLFCLAGTAQSLPGDLNDVAFVSGLDGTTQYYVEILPEGFDKEKEYDLLIGLHGHGSDRWQFAKDKRSECASFRDFAARHEMIAVSPDYRAKTSWMGPAAEKDMVQIIQELQWKYRINRVFLVGGSMGGTAALTFAAIHPGLIDGVVSMNGLANHFEYGKFQDAIAASFGGDKQTIPMEYKKRSAEYWPEKLNMPIAFTVGRQDSVVPPESVIRLARVLQVLGRQILLNVDETGGHETNYKDAYEAMEFVLNHTDRKNK
ncbi:MAG: alpha/beta fold hydrolase [Chitinophagaceae bacterium]|nr:alpha/beta fold hydrolase [Chitinophagaceae bacterium]